MNRSAKRLAAIGFLMLFGLLGGVDIAAACNADCVVVSPPFCRRCLSVGHFTGVTCQNFSNCGCFYTHNTCGLLAAAPAEDELLEDLGLAAAPVCTGSAAPSERS